MNARLSRAEDSIAAMPTNRRNVLMVGRECTRPELCVGQQCNVSEQQRRIPNYLPLSCLPTTRLQAYFWSEVMTNAYTKRPDSMPRGRSAYILFERSERCQSARRTRTHLFAIAIILQEITSRTACALLSGHTGGSVHGQIRERSFLFLL